MRQKLLKRLYRDERANASLEFVVLFPLVILLFCSAMEAGVLSVRQVMLDSAADDVVRTLRLSSSKSPTKDEINAQVCEKAVIFPDCMNAVTVEMKPIDTDTWDIASDSMNCVDRDDGFVPVEEYVSGGRDELMLLRICAVFNPVFPTVGLGAKLSRVNESDYAIVTATAFVNEPI